MADAERARITQADRDAAAKLTVGRLAKEDIEAGRLDGSTLVQAFAQHRITAEQSGRRAMRDEAVKVALTLPIGGGTLSSWVNTNESPMGATRRHIATALTEGTER